MLNDEKSQTPKGWFAKHNEKQNKIEFEINDGVTYVGELAVMPGMKVKKLIDKVEKGEVQITTKTTSKMCIELGFITITLNNAQNIQMIRLKSKVEELEKKIETANKWEQEDLNSTGPFDIDYQYRIKLNGNYFCHAVYIISSQIGYTYTGGTYYYTQSSSRRTSSTGHVVNGIWKRKTN